jgi:hypothetical protein
VATSDSSNQDQSNSGQGGNAGQTGSVSIEALADRVYRLLLKDLRLERDRGLPLLRRNEW